MKKFKSVWVIDVGFDRAVFWKDFRESSNAMMAFMKQALRHGMAWHYEG